METAEKNTSSPPLFVFEEPLKKSSSRKGMILTAFFILILGGIPAATLMLQNTQVLRSRATSASLAAANLTLPEGTNCDFSRSPFICTTKSQEFDIELVSAPDEFTVEATATPGPTVTPVPTVGPTTAPTATPSPVPTLPAGQPTATPAQTRPSKPTVSGSCAPGDGGQYNFSFTWSTSPAPDFYYLNTGGGTERVPSTSISKTLTSSNKKTTIYVAACNGNSSNCSEFATGEATCP